MQITGNVLDVKDTEQVTPTFSKRELWLELVDEKDPKYNQTICIEFPQAQAQKLDEVAIGDNVTVEFNLRGRQHKNRVYNTLSGWKATVNQSQRQTNVAKKPLHPMDKANPVSSPVIEDADDLPF